MKPLEGVRVLEIASIGPGPLAANTFLELGAEVIRVNNPNAVDLLPPSIDPSLKNRINITVDLKSEDGISLVKELLQGMDILLEGNRPGVMEKIGLGPEIVHNINSKTVYIRLTGWGQEGEMKNDAGHDINYLALSGVLSLLGKEGSPPEPPINLVADYGSGTMFAVVSGLLGIYEVKNNNKENILYDVAMFEGVSYLASLMFGLNDVGMWNKQRGTNLLDGGAPFYRCYETKDNKFVAVGALESKFFKELVTKLNLPIEMVNEQMNLDKWPEYEIMFRKIFLTKSRDEWTNIFKNTDSCVTPVLNLEEARNHPHSVSRESFLNNFPRSDNMLKEKDSKIKKNSIDSIFQELNISKDFIEQVEKNGTLLIE
tara:strand:+ start:1150 stop:2262 length:1113 start_codon:yes stop_codon:yes gene_type:complete